MIKSETLFRSFSCAKCYVPLSLTPNHPKSRHLRRKVCYPKWSEWSTKLSGNSCRSTLLISLEVAPNCAVFHLKKPHGHDVEKRLDSFSGCIRKLICLWWKSFHTWDHFDGMIASLKNSMWGYIWEEVHLDLGAEDRFFFPFNVEKQ